MGENNLILKNNPEKLQLIKQLYNYNQSVTFGEKVKNFFKRSNRTEAYSISKWCQILGKSKDNKTVRELIKDLRREGAFEKVDETVNGYPLLALDKDELIRCFGESEIYICSRPLIFDYIKKYEDGSTIATDW